ncbi:porin family protein [Amphritea opalescens]|uniref:porin family protein n=1 Tax=Amphritea opalescens TaxID=2490544 RepID=UPI001F49AB1E|nr:porin family protein [Amphritea opalescens]
MLTILSCSHSFASENPASDHGAEEVKALLDAGRFSEAYDLALNYIDDLEGDPTFDLQYGVAAIDSGHVSEGVFALERVAFFAPENPLVSLELARGYYLLEQFDKAQQLFEAVLLLNPPDNTRVRIATYLDRINQQSFPITRVRSFIEVWRGYDSNINSGPESQTTIVSLSSDALGQGDPFNRVQMGSTIEHQYAADRQLDVSLKGNFRYYDNESEQDFSTLSLSGGHSWTQQNNRYRLGADLQHFSRDGEGYRDLLGINGSWTHQLDKQSQWRLYGGISSLDYVDSSWKDSTQSYLGGNYLLSGNHRWKPLWFAGAFVGQETPDTAGILADAQVDRFFWGANLGVQLSLSDKLTLTPALTFQSSRYKGDDWLYRVRRQDDYTIFNLNLEWAVENNWTVLAGYSVSHANSNIELYEYDRQQTVLGLRYSFK